jgi:hypothetical protein
VLQGYGLKLFQVLYYKEDKFVVRGPKEVADERKETLIVDEAEVSIQPYGTPVVCHGLKYTDFNGKIGDIRSFDEAAKSFRVYFEDESIKPISVKPENVRVLFELPDN